jgi:hypothetical protein
MTCTRPRSPSDPGTVPLGSLRLTLKRVEAEEISSSHPDDAGNEEFKRIPEAARACMLEELALVHALPRIAVCPGVVEAWLEASPSVPVGGEVPVTMKLGNCSDQELSSKVLIGAGSLGSISGERFQDVRLQAREAGEARWEVLTEAAGMLSFLGTVQVNVVNKLGEAAAGSGFLEKPMPSSKVEEESQQLEFSLVASVYVC